jgi:dTDP-4-amino-4,6-dideoxygalactose transaminase
MMNSTMQIPFMRLDRQFADIGNRVMSSIRTVLEKGNVLQSPEIANLEQRLAAMHKCKHSVLVNSGTDALICAIAALGLPEGSRIAVPAMTFVASASSILLNRCRPVFVDVDPRTMLMDSSALMSLIRRREIDAMIAVHLYGQMLDLDEIAKEARENNIRIVEDAAQVIGSTRNGRPAGFHGDVTCLSFDPTKVIGAYGSGGGIVTNDAAIADRVKKLRYHGHAGNMVYERPGFNCQMDSVQAVIIDVKLDYMEQWQARRTEIAQRFAAAVSKKTGIRLLATLEGNIHNYHKFVMVCDRRDELQKKITALGIQTKVQYSLALHQQPLFREIAGSVSLPHAERAAAAVLSLPMYPELTDDEVTNIVDAIAGIET